MVKKQLVEGEPVNILQAWPRIWTWKYREQIQVQSWTKLLGRLYNLTVVYFNPKKNYIKSTNIKVLLNFHLGQG